MHVKIPGVTTKRMDMENITLKLIEDKRIKARRGK